MADLEDFSLSISGYKSFGADGATFGAIRRVNVVIGRNNSGKSALIDAVEYACTQGPIPTDQNHKVMTAKLTFTQKIIQNDMAQIFPPNERYDELNNIYGSHILELLKGASITMEFSKNQQIIFSSTTPDLTTKVVGNVTQIFQRFNNKIRSPFAGKSFFRLAAERNIIPEAHTPGTGIDRHGIGFSNAISNIINDKELDDAIVGINMLNSLNKIMGSDAKFDRIRVQKHSNAYWEVMLREISKGEIALSSSGSGLKTILLVLAFVEFFPSLAARPLSEFVFAFEELENNLHPAL